MRKFTMLVASAGLVLASCGCDGRIPKVVLDQVIRHVYTEEHGPVIVPSIVGASVAPGASALSALCTDQAWRMLAAERLPEIGRIPSMFEIPDPNRPVLITTENSRVFAPESKRRGAQ